MVVPAVPIAIPIGRALGEDVIMSGIDVANCAVPAAGPELRSPIATLALQLRDTIATLALHLREPVGLYRSVIPEAGETIVAIEGFRRKPALTERRDVSARIESRSLTEGRGHRTRAHRGEPW
jgi:hypothetical protein